MSKPIFNESLFVAVSAFEFYSSQGFVTSIFFIPGLDRYDICIAVSQGVSLPLFSLLSNSNFRCRVDQMNDKSMVYRYFLPMPEDQE